ncbi:uncharacterized protein EV154DRAFT_512533 [Mucor mucedo]|uniref:uncharacterized protein n=1 Tax=Mucor mucedo TaxID=29922 RepID=UPI00221F140F|nr:uncharacterized protein EV154DRAFT_512533 [Mucor mucedo]KAI7890117.1 hypothetical protein EV154DRAFT_512533 [Mucor mucedo]
MLSKSSNITLDLLEPTIYVESNSVNSNVIRGTVNINLPKTTTVKTLSVIFEGQLDTKSYSFEAIESSGSFARKKPLARQRLVLYPTLEQENASRPLILNAGLTQYGFEMQIPSGLPESIDCSEIKVEYSVTAVMDVYPTNSFLRVSRGSHKETFKQSVRVARLPYENVLMGDSMSEPIDSRSHQATWLEYQIVVSKKAVALGNNLPVTFRFSPTHEGVIVDRVTLQMLERRDVHRDVTHSNHSVFGIQPCKKNAVTFPRGVLKESWEGTVSYQIPNGRSLSHSTQDYSDFRVSHTLLVSITLSVPGTGRCRVTKLLTFQANIDLLDKTIGDLDTLELPTYDSPPPFDNTKVVFGEYERKFADPPNYSDICA